MKKFQKDEGFTLVELMVVVLIIGILVAIAVPIFNAAKASAQQKTCYANMRTIAGAFQTYLATDPAVAPVDATVMTSLVPNYVKTNPQCPTYAGAYKTVVTTVAGVSSLAVSCPGTAAGAHPTVF